MMHSKAPFSVVKRQDIFNDDVLVVDAEGIVLATVRCHSNTVRERAPEEVMAIANLFASAPELYEACKAALPFVSRFRGGWSTHPPASICSEELAQQLEAAIAKAEGREVR